MAFKPPTPTPPGLWRRTPPAIFPPVMGLFGLGLAWRRAAQEFAVPPGVGEAMLGATVLLFVFSLLAYGTKAARRPAAVTEDLRVLPGRAGLAALAMCLHLLVLTITPYAPHRAAVLLWVGLALHATLIAAVLRGFARGPAEQRRVTPVWHLTFVGPIVAALAAAGLGQERLALALFAATGLAAAAIWGASLAQFGRETVPAPLRPLLAIHLAPAALLGMTAAALGMPGLAAGFAALAAVMLAALTVSALWLTRAGFSPLWGAFTFPLAATASLWLVLGGVWRLPGGLALVAATLIVPPIAWKVMQSWAKGQLAAKTNASVA